MGIYRHGALKLLCNIFTNSSGLNVTITPEISSSKLGRGVGAYEPEARMACGLLFVNRARG
jgi:hypothetical protein